MLSPRMFSNWWQNSFLIRNLSTDGRRLFATRILRMFAYGFISVILGLYLIAAGLSEQSAGLVLTLTLLGDAAISLWITTQADRIGRRRMLMIGGGLMLLAGIVFAGTSAIIPLTLAAIIGTISPSGGEVGPFLSIEQSALTQTIRSEHRTAIFAWYNLFGSVATALGALIGGAMAEILQAQGMTELESYRVILLIYAGLGGLLMILFAGLSPVIEVVEQSILVDRFGLAKSRKVVLHLSLLFSLDAFAGGFIVQSLIAYWFHVKFDVETATLGVIFFWANLFAGLSALAAARLAARFGLINTMVFTHLPSNILLMLVPLMPSLPLAVGLLLIRFSISQMDVPTRQSYIMAVVDPAERSAAAGITGIARTIGASFSPVITGFFLQASLLSLPFFLAGGLKIIYDLSLYRAFITVKPPEEQG